jgi:putative inorganic carbon (HCO3(-)) transporter
MKPTHLLNDKEPTEHVDQLARAMRWTVLCAIIGITLAIVINVSDSTMLKPGILVISSALLVTLWLFSVLRERQCKMYFSGVTIAFIGYIGVSALSLFVALNIRIGVENIAQLVCCFILFATSVSAFRDQQSRTQLVFVLIIVTALACGVAIVQLCLSGTPGDLFISSERAAISTFGNAAYFAGFLVLMMPIVTSHIILSREHTMRRFLLGILLLTMLFLLMKTETRSAWAAVAISLFIFAIMNFKSTQQRRKVFLLSAGMLIVMLILFPALFQRRLTTMFEMNPQSSFARRVFFYEGAWKAFLSSPIIGNGVGNFIAFLPKYRSHDYWMYRSEDVVPHAHNEFLEIASEIGIIGIIMFLTVIAVFIHTMREGLNDVTKNRVLLIGFLSGLLGVLIDNLASMNFRTIPVAAASWIIAGMSLSLLDLPKKIITFSLPAFSAKIRFLPFVLFVAVMIWYIPTIVDRYTAESNLLSGILLRATNQNAAAAEKFQETVRHDPASGAQFYLATNLVHNEQFNEARSHITTLLQSYPYYPKAHIILAVALFELKDTAQAMSAMNTELEIEDSPQALYYASYFTFQMHTPEREYAYIKQLLTNADKSGMADYVDQVLLRFPMLCKMQRDTNECSDLLAHLYETFKENTPVLNSIAKCYEEFGLWNEAHAVWKQLYERDQNDLPAKEHLRQSEEHLGNSLDTTRTHH